MPARLLFSTGSLYPIDIAHCFALAAEAGFDGLEVMCDARWSSRDPGYLRALSARYGLAVRVLHTPFELPVPGWDDAQDSLELVQHTLALADMLEAESIVVHLPQRFAHARVALAGRHWRVPRPGKDSRLKNWMENDLAAQQKLTRVGIAVENMPAARLLGRKFSANWWNSVTAWAGVHSQLTLDTTHWATFGVDPLLAYRAAGARVRHVHLSNFDGREHRLPHEGQLDLAAFLGALADDGFDGTVSLELHPDALAFDDAAALRAKLQTSLAFCRAHLTPTRAA